MKWFSWTNIPKKVRKLKGMPITIRESKKPKILEDRIKEVKKLLKNEKNPFLKTKIEQLSPATGQIHDLGAPIFRQPIPHIEIVSTPPEPSRTLVKGFRCILEIGGVMFVDAPSVIRFWIHLTASIYSDSGLY